MKQETYIQLSLFDLLCPVLDDVLNYFISIQKSIDPVWWASRWGDMVAYATILNPNQKPRGCMAPGKEYPFNVWNFVKYANREEFINKGISKAIKSWA
jgi:hypothetical protein